MVDGLLFFADLSPRREGVAAAAGEEVPAIGLLRLVAVIDHADREQFSQDAADAPDVNGLAVVLLE